MEGSSGNMLKSDRLYSSTSSLVAGLFLISIGILMILGLDKLYFNFINLLMLATLGLGVFQFISYFWKKQKKAEKQITFTRAFFNLLFCLVLSFYPKIPSSIIPLLFAFYFILNAVIKIITYIILFNEKAEGRLKELFMVILYLVIGVPLFISPLKNVNTMLWIMGGYFILLGINFLIDFINVVLPRKIKTKLRRRIKITLPVILEIIIPYQVLNEINYFINKDEDNKIVYQDKNSDVKPDLEIFIHCSMRGYNRFGHVDLLFEDQVISYGNYDDDSKTFFNTVGDGVVFVTDKEHYIPFCIKHSYKTIFGFGLKLTDSQKKNIKKYINDLSDNMYEWYPPYVMALQKMKKVNKDKYEDYSSCLYKSTGAKFYKFNSGRFKKYFALGVNCCLLSDSIIGKSGSDILKMNGIITPGTYYEYLNREFKKKNSAVITKNIYNAESTGIKNKSKKLFDGFSS